MGITRGWHEARRSWRLGEQAAANPESTASTLSRNDPHLLLEIDPLGVWDFGSDSSVGGACSRGSETAGGAQSAFTLRPIGHVLGRSTQLGASTGLARVSLLRYPLRVDLDALPGGDLIARGLSDLSRGEPTIEALLVAIGRPRLRRLGFDVPEIEAPEHRLYDLLASNEPEAAHSRYNALLGRLTSFERAVECVARRTRKD